MEPQDLILALLKAGMTQLEIAERTGMTQGTVSKIANGGIRDVRSRTFMALTALLESVGKPKKKPAVIKPSRRAREEVAEG